MCQNASEMVFAANLHFKMVTSIVTSMRPQAFEMFISLGGSLARPLWKMI